MIRRCLGLLAVPFLALPALADVPVSYTRDGRTVFSVDMPDFWTLRSGGAQRIAPPDGGEARPVPRVLSLHPEGGERGAWVGLLSPGGVSTLDQAGDYLRDMGRFLLTDVNPNAARSTRIAGYPARVGSGTGRRGGRTLTYTAVALDLPGSDIAIAVILVPGDVPDVLLSEIDGILRSLRAGR